MAGRAGAVPRQPADPAVAGLHRHARHVGPAAVPGQRRPGRRRGGRAARHARPTWASVGSQFGVRDRPLRHDHPPAARRHRPRHVGAQDHPPRARRAAGRARGRPRRRAPCAPATCSSRPDGRLTRAHHRDPPRRGHHPARPAAQARRRRPDGRAGEGRPLLRRRHGQRRAGGAPRPAAAPRATSWPWRAWTRSGSADAAVRGSTWNRGRRPRLPGWRPCQAAPHAPIRVPRWPDAAVRRARLRGDPGRVRGARGVPARGAGRGRAPGRASRRCPNSTRPTSRWSRSTRRAAAISTRPCTWPPAATATGSATRSPTSARSCALGGALDAEARRRGQTLYSPDRRTPLHPPVLSEGAASLLPGQLRPAVALDDRPRRRRRADRRSTCGGPACAAAPSSTTRPSRQQADAGTLPEAARAAAARSARCCRRAGGRTGRDRARAPPSRRSSAAPDGGWTLDLRGDLPVEALERADLAAHRPVRRRAHARRRRRHPADAAAGPARGRRPAAAARARARRRLAGRRGPGRGDRRPGPGATRACRVPRGGGGAAARRRLHALRRRAARAARRTRASAAPYAHVTAPLRRLVDRFGTEVCLALAAGARARRPELRAALPELPALMAASDRRTREVERAVVDATEAWLLRGREGEVFGAVVVDARGRAGARSCSTTSPSAAAAPVRDWRPGTRVQVRLEEADVAARTVRFTVASHDARAVPDRPAAGLRDDGLRRDERAGAGHRRRSTSARASPTTRGRRRCSTSPGPRSARPADQYPPGPGMPELREAIAAHRRALPGLDLRPRRRGPGDRRGHRGPHRRAAGAARHRRRGRRCSSRCTTATPAGIAMAGGVARPVPLRPPAAATGRGPSTRPSCAPRSPRARKLLLLNTPHNPTGKVFTAAELRADRRPGRSSTTCSCSPTRSTSTWCSPAPARRRIADACPGMRERTLVVCSAGKTFNVTGWKIGWICGPARAGRRRPDGEAVPHLRQRRPVPAGHRRRARACPTTYFAGRRP